MFMVVEDSESATRLVAVVDVVGNGCRLRFFGFFGTLNFVVSSCACSFDFGELVLCCSGSVSVSERIVGNCVSMLSSM